MKNLWLGKIPGSQNRTEPDTKSYTEPKDI